MPSAQIKKLTLGSTKEPIATLGNGGYDRYREHVLVNTPRLAGTLGHEAGHAMPGKVSDRLTEEARATQNFIAAHGKDHPEVPDLLRSFGTYAQGENRPWFIRPANERLETLRGRISRRSFSRTPEHSEAMKAEDAWRRSGSGRPQMETALNADAKPLEQRRDQLLEQAASAPDDARRLLQKRIAHYNKRLSAVTKYHEDERQRRDKDVRGLFDVVHDKFNAQQKRDIRRIDSRLSPTLQDYANLQGADRQLFEDWLGQVRGTIDSHFWEGAGNTALEPILAEIQRLRG
jgi:hypothetical protein